MSEKLFHTSLGVTASRAESARPAITGNAAEPTLFDRRARVTENTP